MIGSFIVFGLREFLSTLVPWWQYVLGGVYVATILYLPTGLMGIPERLRQRRAKSDNREEDEETGIRVLLSDEAATTWERTMTSTLLRRVGPLLLSGCVVLGLTAAAKSEEMRIGYLAPTTGVFAQVGKDMVDGFKMYLDEKNNELGGADVKFIVEDEQGKPDTAVTKAKKLILQDKVHFFVGGLLASTGYALAPVSTAEKVVYISSVSSADDLTQRDLPKYPYFFRTGWSSSQPSHPFGQWACEQGYKKIAIIAADYAFGYEVAGGFQRAFEACAGRSCRKSGRRSPPRTSGPTSRPSRRTPTRSSR